MEIINVGEIGYRKFEDPAVTTIVVKEMCECIRARVGYSRRLCLDFDERSSLIDHLRMATLCFS